MAIIDAVVLILFFFINQDTLFPHLLFSQSQLNAPVAPNDASCESGNGFIDCKDEINVTQMMAKDALSFVDPFPAKMYFQNLAL